MVGLYGKSYLNGWFGGTPILGYPLFTMKDAEELMTQPRIMWI